MLGGGVVGTKVVLPGDGTLLSARVGIAWQECVLQDKGIHFAICGCGAIAQSDTTTGGQIPVFIIPCSTLRRETRTTKCLCVEIPCENGVIVVRVIVNVEVRLSLVVRSGLSSASSKITVNSRGAPVA